MRAVLLLMVCALSGCASPRAVLVNDKGEHITCAASSAGIIGSMVAQNRYDSCVSDAKEKGYRVTYEQK